MSELVESVERAVVAMDWLTEADDAAVEVVKSYALAIDQALDSGDPAAAAKALYLGPHMLNALSVLGGTPKGRKELELKEVARGKLAAVRNIRDRPAPSKKRAG